MENSSRVNKLTLIEQAVERYNERVKQNKEELMAGKVKVHKVIDIEYGVKRDYITIQFSNGITLKRSAFKTTNTFKNPRECDLSGEMIPVGDPMIKVQANFKGMSVYYFSYKAIDNRGALRGDTPNNRTKLNKPKKPEPKENLEVEDTLTEELQLAEAYCTMQHENIHQEIKIAEKRVSTLKRKKEVIGKLASRTYRLLGDIKAFKSENNI